MHRYPTRYAHENGRTGLCFDDTGEYIITCGSDGDVRVFQGFEDDDTITHRIGDTVYAVAYHDKLYAAAEDNSVRILTLREGQSEGILTRFTAPVTSICLSTDGTFAVLGCSDFTVRWVNVKTKEQKTMIEHEAPVLHVALNSALSLVASSSCDGTVKIYGLQSNSVIKTLTGFPRSNDYTTSKICFKVAWDKPGEVLFVPKDKKIVAYNASTWEKQYTLSHSSLNEVISIVSVSSCGKYLAASACDGSIVIFDLKTKQCVNRDRHRNKTALSGLAWSPRGAPRLVWVDCLGQLGVFDEPVPAASAQVTAEEPVTTTEARPTDEGLTAAEVDQLFDAEDDDMLLQTAELAAPDTPHSAHQPHNDDMSVDSDAEVEQGAAEVEDRVAPVRVVPRPAPTLQPAFQPAATPLHCSHRFMKWNSVGVILQYNTEEENSITIEFHDSATHHALHVNNTYGYAAADLSREAVLLATQPDTDDEPAPSQLTCMHFSSWDSNKEWTTAMPTGEQIEAVTLGEGWCAAATDRRNVRIFSLAGVQRHIISIPGPVVAMAGCMNQLLIVYHRACGILGDQCLGVKLLNVVDNIGMINLSEDLPISSTSVLVWLGFSEEGTPVTVDSCGVVRMLHRGFGNNWCPVANLRKHVKGKSDNYWIVGIGENPQQIRAILCKGINYPSILPKPNVNVLPFEMPVCELSTDKGTIEEKIMRFSLIDQHFDWWVSQGLAFDEAQRNDITLPLQEALMRLFALSCKTQREQRALEVAEIMPEAHTVQLAIKYASRLNLLQLAERLGAVARAKTDQPAPLSHDDQAPRHSTAIAEVEAVEAAEMSEGGEEDKAAPVADQTPQETTAELEQGTSDEKHIEEKNVLAPTLSQNAKKNPFKISSQKSLTDGRGSSVFDHMEKSKPRNLSTPFESLQKKTKVLKAKDKKPKTILQPTAIDDTRKRKREEVDGEPHKEVKRKSAGSALADVENTLSQKTSAKLANFSFQKP